MVVVGGGALEQTVMVSVAGSGTDVPAGGLWDTTSPFCDGSHIPVVAVATVRPWPISTPVASD